MDARWIIAVLYVASLLMTLGGLGAAWLSVRNALVQRTGEVASHREIVDEYSERMLAPGADMEALRVELDTALEAAGVAGAIEDNTYGGLPYHGAKAELAAMRLALDGTRGQLGWAGAGVVLGAVASLWALWPGP